VFSFLFIEMDWSSAATQMVVDIFGWALIASAPLVLLWRTTPFCAIATVWVSVELLTRLVANQRFDDLAPLSMALRVAAPIALLMIARQRTTLAAWALRLAASATFAGHGIQCLQQNPIFIDYLLGASMQMGFDVSESAARDAMIVIGAVDIFAAGWLLFRPLRPVLYYMAAWGLITALARTVHSGWGGLTETLVRTIHCTGPLAVLAHFHHTKPRA